MQTPGYFGHIELARPVFYIQYLSTILKILRCVCFKCSKLLISKQKYKQALKLVGDARWKYVFSLASKIRRCGEDTEDGCGCLQANKIRKEGLSSIFAEWKNDANDEENIVIKLIPELVLKIFKRKLDRNGDLVSKIYFTFVLPEIKSSSERQFKWIKNIGTTIIKSVAFYIQGRKIDEHYGEWLHIWHELNLTSDQFWWNLT
jgi:DNA-directed RNA polymerase beta' subunit